MFSDKQTLLERLKNMSNNKNIPTDITKEIEDLIIGIEKMNSIQYQYLIETAGDSIRKVLMFERM